VSESGHARLGDGSGAVRRERLDRVIALGASHLTQLLRRYIDYFNSEHVHTPIADASIGRTGESRPSARAKAIGLPRIGGLQHRYCWRTPA
jgi:hypothetical protein